MATGIARRELLQLGAAVPLFGKEKSQVARNQENTQITGTVNDVHGTKIGDAEVVAYDISNNRPPTELNRATTKTRNNQKGQFEITVESVSRILLLAQKRDGRHPDRIWFNGRKFNSSGKTNQNIVLSRQTLFGPKLVAEPAFGAGAISLWRWIKPNDATKQTIYLEIVGTTPVGGDFEDHPWEVNSAPTDRWGEIDHATFSLTVPEHVEVAYQGHSEITRFDTLPAYTSLYETIDTDIAREIVQRWHPTRTPQLPLFTLDEYQNPAALSSYQKFEESKRDDRVQREENEEEMKNFIASAGLSSHCRPLGESGYST